MYTVRSLNIFVWFKALDCPHPKLIFISIIQSPVCITACWTARIAADNSLGSSGWAAPSSQVMVLVCVSAMLTSCSVASLSDLFIHYRQIFTLKMIYTKCGDDWTMTKRKNIFFWQNPRWRKISFARNGWCVNLFWLQRVQWSLSFKIWTQLKSYSTIKLGLDLTHWWRSVESTWTKFGQNVPFHHGLLQTN